MFKRIVKLTFRAEEVDNFLAIFEAKKDLIRNFEGCLHLELWRGKDNPNILFTYSFWENEAALEAYRHSALFKATWADTKALFGGKPEAWSVDMLEELL